jgi:propionyl-CoA synthetase
VHWHRRWDAVLDASRPPFYRWFPGAQVNTCYNALDRHVDGGRADQSALIYDSPLTGTIRSFTFRELRDEVARFAGVLAKLGVVTIRRFWTRSKWRWRRSDIRGGGRRSVRKP